MANLFDKIYSSGAEALKKISKPIVISSVKSEFSNYINSIYKVAVDSAKEVIKQRGLLGTPEYSIESVVESRANLAAAKETLAIVKDEYKITFGEEYKEVDIDLDDIIAVELVETAKD